MFTIPGISVVKDFGINKIYGIGISQAILREQSQQFKGRAKESLYSIQLSSISSEFTPDRPASMSSSLSGMPVMCYLKFIGGNYIDLEGNSVNVPDITFETCIITATMNPDIVSTKISGRRFGSVKEYIGLDDWEVEVRAIISADAPVNDSVLRVNQNGVYPKENIEQIFQMLSAPLAIPIECWFLNQLNINYLVAQRGTQIGQIEGEYTNQVITIPFVSDMPLILKVAR